MRRATDLIRKSISVLLAAAFTVVMFSGMLADTVSAASVQTFDINYQVNSKSARDMLSIINDWRTGGSAWYWNKQDSKKIQCGKLSALTYDYKLEAIALQRAYEIAVSFSHIRPNGGNAFTCTAGSTGSCGENIAAGNSTTNAVFNQWKEEDKKYSGQGHRRNMLESGFTSIGIAHVEYQGVHYWVQEFGYKNSGAGETDALSGTVTGKVDICLSDFKLTLSALPEINVEPGSVSNFPVISGRLKSGDTWGHSGILVTSKELPATWTSSNSSIVTVEGTAFKAVSYGNCKLTATVNCGGKDYSVSTTASVLNPGVTGWQTDENGKKYYFDNGKLMTGWKTIGSSKYYFDPVTGAATTGVRKISGKYYLFASSGVMQKSGWKKDGKGNTYYLRKSGAAYTKKWSKKKRKWYYFGANGKMVKGKTLKIGKKRYKFKSNGVCKNKR